DEKRVLDIQEKNHFKQMPKRDVTDEERERAIEIALKNDFKSKTIRAIKNLEKRIHNKHVSEQDWIEYEVHVNMLERIERVKTWPVDLGSVTKIVIMGIVGNIPALLQYFLK
ncbi:MAG: hypothetical protein ACXQTW_08645, partial [Candidatus Methanospirareceae archaeon]